MWKLLVAFLLIPSALQGQVRVEVRNSEVWIERDGAGMQLTHDGKAKLQAALSPSNQRIAYYEECPAAEQCTPSVVVLDLEGRRLSSFVVKPISSNSPCKSILSVAWAGENAIAAVCHINPSLSEYVETDLATGRSTRDLLGYGFVSSRDGKWVAHVGWIPHFAPPFAQSNYLQIDHTTIYPLPKGMKPVKQKDAEPPPDVVRQQGLTYTGIHQFSAGPTWSPDSKRVALLDCTYDWTANDKASLSTADGKESNRQCSVAIVSLTGETVLFPLAGTDLGGSHLEWVTPRELSVRSGNSAKIISAPW